VREVAIKLRFLQPCLGSHLHKQSGETSLYRLPRTSGGEPRVMLLTAWWRAIMRFAAATHNIAAETVDSIAWDPVVTGKRGRYRRFVDAPKDGKRRYAMHEAFMPGAVVGVNAVLPDSLDTDLFWRMLDHAGRYRGISPYKPGVFGHFEVMEVRARKS